MTRASTRRRPRRQRGDADPPGPHGSRPRGTVRSAPPGGGRLRWRWGRACPSGQPRHLADVTRHRSSAAILVAPSGRDTRFLAPDGSRQVGVMRRAMSAKGAGHSGDCWNPTWTPTGGRGGMGAQPTDVTTLTTITTPRPIPATVATRRRGHPLVGRVIVGRVAQTITP